MKEVRRLGVHLLLLIVAAVAAWVESRPEDAADRPLKPGEVQMWGGSWTDVTRLAYETKRQVVSLEQKKDDVGSYFIGSVTAGPGEPEPEATDAGADAGRPPPPSSKVEPATFVSIDVAQKLAKAVAPMRAERAIGEVSADREKAFGLDASKGTLIVEIGGKKHTLVVGGTTPGSGSRYIRDADTKQVYVIENTVIRDLEGGASRLSERAVHEWKFPDIYKVKVIAGDKTREVVQSGTEGRRFWASPDKPDENDETAGNWLNKLKNLRPVNYLEKLPEGASKILRVEFTGEKKELGYLELFKDPNGDQNAFVISSEYLRLHATVAKTLGEQVADDLASIFEAPSEAPADSASAAPSASAPPNPHEGH